MSCYPSLFRSTPPDKIFPVCLSSRVKSYADRLSETQKVWLSVLGSAGVACEVAHVFTEEQQLDKEIKDAAAKEKAATARKRKRGKEGANEEGEEEEDE